VSNVIQIVSLILALLATSCSSNEPRAIFRSKSDERVPKKAVASTDVPQYPWNDSTSSLQVVTKEFFRCKGSSLNPPHIIYENGKEKDRTWDCGGVERHGLPVRNGEEYVYPALLEILNFIQTSLKKPVIITSGHRCPSHEQYVGSTSSKHLIAAAVSFMVEGHETRPERVVREIVRYYEVNPLFAGIKFTQTETGWKNKEVFFRVYTPTDGRNLDNRHPFPYIELEVRFDRQLSKPVTFSWGEAQTYLRK